MLWYFDYENNLILHFLCIYWHRAKRPPDCPYLPLRLIASTTYIRTVFITIPTVAWTGILYLALGMGYPNPMILKLRFTFVCLQRKLWIHLRAKISFSIWGDMNMHKWLWKCRTETNVMENIKSWDIWKPINFFHPQIVPLRPSINLFSSNSSLPF